MSISNRLYKQKLLLRISVITCLVSLVVFSVLLMMSNQSQEEALASNYTAQQVIVAVNQQRKDNGLKPLAIDSLLMNAAQNKANDMSSNSYFSHVSPSGVKWSVFIKNTGYSYIEAGENLANGFDTVPEMVTAWMNSPSHRENILNPHVSETGVGISFGKLDGFPTIFVAQNFGEQKIDDAEPNTPRSTPSVIEPASTPVPESEPELPPLKQNLGELLIFPERIIE